MTGTISPNLPEGGEPRGTADGKVKSSLITLRNAINATLNSSNKLEGAEIAEGTVPATALAGAARLGTWYTPTVIATEETRENTSYGKLGTADEVANVVLPTNGLILVGYQAMIKASAAAGKAAIFVGTNQLKIANTGANAAPEVQNAATAEFGKWWPLSSSSKGLVTTKGTEYTGDVTTGQILGTGGSEGATGFCTIFAAAGTYAVSVQFSSSSGNVKVKNRKLWVATLGY